MANKDRETSVSGNTGYASAKDDAKGLDQGPHTDESKLTKSNLDSANINDTRDKADEQVNASSKLKAAKEEKKMTKSDEEIIAHFIRLKEKQNSGATLKDEDFENGIYPGITLKMHKGCVVVEFDDETLSGVPPWSAVFMNAPDIVVAKRKDGSSLIVKNKCESDFEVTPQDAEKEGVAYGSPQAYARAQTETVLSKEQEQKSAHTDVNPNEGRFKTLDDVARERTREDTTVKTSESKSKSKDHKDR